MAADLNNSFALYNLGCYYEEGVEIKQDYKKAIECFERAAKQNDPCSLYRLGCIYEDGKGVEQDYKIAIEYSMI